MKKKVKMCIISEVVCLYRAVEATVLHDAPVIDVTSNGAPSAHTKLLSLFQ